MSSTHEEWKFVSADGLSLYAQSWRPAGQSRALVALVHGIGEHSGRYADLVDHLVADGFEVHGFDHRGHGRSPGARGHVNAWTDYVQDVREFLHGSGELNPGLPVFLYGHSMGALIALDYALAYPDGLAGLVVSGVPLRPSGVAKRHLIMIARVLSRIVPAFSISLGLDVNGISRDPAAVKAYREDPLVHPLASMRWGTEILASIDRVRSRAGEVRLPILILHGGADPINAVAGSKELHETVSSGDKSLRVYPGTLHEPHNDLDRTTVSEDVQRWLGGRLGEA
ncbi:MAG: lysophospholipase [Gemmatimonadaceae bacterium]